MTLPTFPEEERFEVEPLAMPGFFRVLCRVGYTERLIRNAAFLEGMNQALVEDIRFKALAAKYALRLLTCIALIILTDSRVKQWFLQCCVQVFRQRMHALEAGQTAFLDLCKILVVWCI